MRCTATHPLEGFTGRFKGVIPELRKTVTYARGSEMACLVELTKATGIDVYFCDPHSPWQCGSNENMRNDRPQKILGFKTPREVYTELLQKAKAEKIKNSSTGIALQT